MPPARRASRPAKPPHTATWAFAAIAGAALLVRLLYVTSVRDAPFMQTLQTNPQRYHLWAALILDGPAPRPPFDQAPGYAYLLAWLYRWFGRSPMPVIYLQAALDACTCALIALIGSRMFGARAGIIGGALAAVCGTLVYFSGELLPATPSLFLFMAATTAAMYGRWWWAGICFAGAVLLRTECLLGLPLFAAAAWRGEAATPARRSVLPRIVGTRVAAVCAPTLLSLFALTAWNVVANGHWSPPLTGGGLNVWIGNNPHADGVNPFMSGPLLPITERVRDQAQGDAASADRLFLLLAVDFWRQLPREAAALLYRKARWTLVNRELPNTSDIDWQRSYSWLFHLPGLPLPFGVVLVLGLPGLAVLGQRRWPMLPLVAGPWVALATCVVFFTNARFRLLLLPALLVLAGASLERLWSLLPQWRRHQGQLAQIAAAAAAGVWLAFSDPHAVRSYRIPEIEVNAGIAERQAGHFDEAIVFLRRALEAIPEDAIAWVHLALALEQSGDAAGAAAAYLDGLARSKDREHLPEMTRRFFVRHQLDPHDLEVYRGTNSPAIQAATKQAVIKQLSATPARR